MGFANETVFCDACGRFGMRDGKCWYCQHENKPQVVEMFESTWPRDLYDAVTQYRCCCGCALDVADLEVKDNQLTVYLHPCKDCLGTAERNALKEEK